MYVVTWVFMYRSSRVEPHFPPVPLITCTQLCHTNSRLFFSPDIQSFALEKPFYKSAHFSNPLFLCTKCQDPLLLKPHLTAVFFHQFWVGCEVGMFAESHVTKNIVAYKKVINYKIANCRTPELSFSKKVSTPTWPFVSK